MDIVKFIFRLKIPFIAILMNIISFLQLQITLISIFKPVFRLSLMRIGYAYGSQHIIGQRLSNLKPV
jgi:hypothetical protein